MVRHRDQGYLTKSKSLPLDHANLLALVWPNRFRILYSSSLAAAKNRQCSPEMHFRGTSDKFIG